MSRQTDEIPAVWKNNMSFMTVISRCNGRIKNPFALDGHNYQWDDLDERRGRKRKQ